MAINALLIDWFAPIIKNYILKSAVSQDISILELGPQDIERHLPSHQIAKLMKLHSCTLSFLSEEVDNKWRARDLVYRSLGISKYSSIDLFDERSDFKESLERVIDLGGEKYDIATNFGTSEHLFNPGNALITVHNALKPGGISLYVLPCMGDLAHGVYNINPSFVKVLAEANNYEILSWLYVDNFEERGVIRDHQLINGSNFTFNFSSLPIQVNSYNFKDRMKFTRKVEKNYAINIRNYYNAFFSGFRTRINGLSGRFNDYMFFALKKHGDSAFVFPDQYGYEQKFRGKQCR